MCKFADVSLNKKITLNVDKGFCLECKEELKFSGPAVYIGHDNGDKFKYDVFNLLEPRYCQNCEIEIIQYREVCQSKVMEFSENRNTCLSNEELTELLKYSEVSSSKYLVEEILRKWRRK